MYDYGTERFGRGTSRFLVIDDNDDFVGNLQGRMMQQEKEGRMSEMDRTWLHDTYIGN